MIDNFMERIKRYSGGETSLRWLIDEGGLEAVPAVYILHYQGKIGVLRQVSTTRGIEAGFVFDHVSGGRSFAAEFPGGDAGFVQYMVRRGEAVVTLDEIGRFVITYPKDVAAVFVLD